MSSPAKDGDASARARALQGEVRFARFVEERRERAFRIAYRMVGGDAAAAEDVAQEAFVRACRGLGQFRGEASLDTWFYRILVREVLRYRRWRRLRQLWTPAVEVVPDAADPAPQADPGLRRRIGSAMEQLSRGQRDAVVLVHLEGFTVAESAAMLGKAVGTVKSHLQRALESLRLQLADLRDLDAEPARATPAGEKAEEESSS